MGRLLGFNLGERLSGVTGLWPSGGLRDLIYMDASLTSYQNTAWSNLAWCADLHPLEPAPTRTCTAGGDNVRAAPCAAPFGCCGAPSHGCR